MKISWLGRAGSALKNESGKVEAKTPGKSHPNAKVKTKTPNKSRPNQGSRKHQKGP